MERAHALNEQDDGSPKLTSHTPPQYDDDEYDEMERHAKLQEFKVKKKKKKAV